MKYLVANWKMNPGTLAEAKTLWQETEQIAKKNPEIQIIICPPFPFLEELAKLRNETALGAQNCHFAKYGEYTGEVSAKMLAKLGVNYVILGHSERRLLESREEVGLRIESALSENLSPIVCVGELVREIGIDWKKELREILEATFQNISAEKMLKLIIAYEPIWAVGSGAEKSASTMEFLEAYEMIKDWMKNKLGADIEIPILYGGSINEHNILPFWEVSKYGLMIGRASLEPKILDKISDNE